jgi:ABC-type sugar transport system permease subunit
MNNFWSNARRHIWSYVFVMPMFILFLGFTLYPLLASVRYTLYDWDGIGIPRNFVGLEHYINIAQDAFFWNAFKNTLVYTVALVPTQLTLALGLAIVLNSQWLKARYIFRAVFFSPVVTSLAIVGIVISLLTSTAGHDINRVLVNLAITEKPIDWLGDPRTAMWVVIAVGVWIGLGYPMIYFLAALQSVKQDLYDAARIDGAGNLALFWHITIPSIRPVGLVVLLITLLHSLRVFDTVQVMTRGGPYFATDVVGTYIYRLAFYATEGGDTYARLGYASAAAFFMGLLVMGVSILQLAAVRYAARQRKENQIAKP